MKQVEDLRNLSVEELKSKAEVLYKELFNLNQQRYAGNVEKPHLFLKAKKEIARIKTILREKDLK